MPSMILFGGSGVCPKVSMVVNMSYVATRWLDALPALILPGHRAMAGIRMPPSQLDPNTHKTPHQSRHKSRHHITAIPFNNGVHQGVEWYQSEHH